METRYAANDQQARYWNADEAVQAALEPYVTTAGVDLGSRASLVTAHRPGVVAASTPWQ